MSSGRPPFSFVLIDLPSDHEVDAQISTECEVIKAILHNRVLGSRVRHFRASSLENFDCMKMRPYRDCSFVHLGTHGSKSGISLIGGEKSWAKVGERLKTIAPLLKRQDKHKRVLALSCCFSSAGFEALRPALRGHFTGCYHFAEARI